MLKEVSFMHSYRVGGDPADTYFGLLPANDLGGLFSFLHSRRDDLANATILDIGANIGLAAICMHDILPNARIHSFEPSRISSKFLRENLKQNDIQQVTPHEMAIGSDNRIVKFNEHENHAGSRIEEADGAYDVKQMSVDSFVQTYDLGRVSFVKVDVEGYELEALKGAAHVLNHHNPLVMFECNPMALRMSRIPLHQFLSGAMDALGPLFAVEYGGSSHALPSDCKSAEKMLEGLMTNDHHVFDLVNRID